MGHSHDFENSFCENRLGGGYSKTFAHMQLCSNLISSLAGPYFLTLAGSFEVYIEEDVLFFVV